MKVRRASILAVIVLAGSLATLLAAHLIASMEQPALATMLPDGALLYIESPDFGSLISAWNQSSEKQSWLKSDNYAVFSRSRLFGRLSAAQSEFAAAAGLPTDMQLISEVAGKQSAFAWYDIGKLEFVYFTHMPSSAFSQSRLWQARGKFERREAAGADFYVRVDPQSNRTVAFAAADDWVILGTREDLVADTLARIKGQKSRSLGDEPWYVDSVAQAKSPGDLRMVLNLEKIVPSPYFRSYWIQQNVTEMKQYRAAISDLYREKNVYREERVLLRRTNAVPVEAKADVSTLAAAVAPGAGFYQAISAPGAARVLVVLEEKLLDPTPGSAVSTGYAPNPSLTEEQAGQASDLDTRIDQAPMEDSSRATDSWESLKNVLASAQLDGLLTIESATPQSGSTFDAFHSAVVLSAAADWQLDPIKSAISSGLQPKLTASRLGVEWLQKDGYQQCNGLLPLFLGVQGRYLILANDSGLLLSLKTKLTQPTSTAEPAVYVAGFNHASERAPFVRVTTLIDRANQRGSSVDGLDAGSPDRSPAFFSGNIASLSQTFNDMTEERITVRDAGEKVTQAVTYRWK